MKEGRRTERRKVRLERDGRGKRRKKRSLWKRDKIEIKNKRILKEEKFMGVEGRMKRGKDKKGEDERSVREIRRGGRTGKQKRENKRGRKQR